MAGKVLSSGPTYPSLMLHSSSESPHPGQTTLHTVSHLGPWHPLLGGLHMCPGLKSHLSTQTSLTACHRAFWIPWEKCLRIFWFPPALCILLVLITLFWIMGYYICNSWIINNLQPRTISNLPLSSSQCLEHKARDWQAPKYVHKIKKLLLQGTPVLIMSWILSLSAYPSSAHSPGIRTPEPPASFPLCEAPNGPTSLLPMLRFVAQ